MGAENFSEKLKLFLKSRKISQRQVAVDTDSTPPRVNNLISGRERFGLKSAKLWGTLYGIDPLWLMSLGEQGTAPVHEEKPTISVDGIEGIPYYEVENFECGSPGGFGAALEKASPDGHFKFPWLKNDGNTFCVKAHGNSMVNMQDPVHSINHGSYVALRRSQVGAIQWGEVYALATADGYIIKKLMPSESEGCVRCVSFNAEEYPAFDLPASDIYDYAIVVGVANINLW